MKFFDIKFPQLIEQLLPRGLRQTRIIRLLKALTLPIQLLNASFWNNRNSNLYKLKITPQVCFLEKVLNDRYDTGARRISITDVVIKNISFLFQRSENKPFFINQRAALQPKFIYTKQETNSKAADFLVIVPTGIGATENELTAFINGYKLASKDFKIQYS